MRTCDAGILEIDFDPLCLQLLCKGSSETSRSKGNIALTNVGENVVRHLNGWMVKTYSCRIAQTNTDKVIYHTNYYINSHG
jgi:hypothetical protein